MVCSASVPAMLYYLLRFLVLQRCSPPLFYPPMRLCLGFIAAKAAAEEAARMAARARRARQLVGKEIFRCY